MIVGLSYLIGLGYGAYLVFHQTITLGQLVSFNVYLGMLIWPMFAIGELINVMQRGNASLDRVQETLSAKQDIKNPENPSIVETPASVTFKDVHFQYPSSKTANLKGIKLHIERGKRWGL